MAEISISIPEEMKKELEELGDPSALVRLLLKKELLERARLRSIVAKSKLTEQDVEELSDKINKALSKRFRESVK